MTNFREQIKNENPGKTKITNQGEKKLVNSRRTPPQDLKKVIKYGKNICGLYKKEKKQSSSHYSPKFSFMWSIFNFRERYGKYLFSFFFFCFIIFNFSSKL